MKITHFPILSWRAAHPTDPMTEGLERQRQKMLADPWRPPHCAVPFTPAEARDYKEPCLDDPVIRHTFRQLAASGAVEACAENALARLAIQEMNEEAARRAAKVETLATDDYDLGIAGSNVLPFNR